MIPVLYSASETEFITNGIGRLSDTPLCHVIEERNGGYELEMRYPITGIHFEDLLISNIIYAKPSDGKNPQPFRIYDITKPINGIVTVKAEHVSYQLSNIPVFPIMITAASASTALTYLTQNVAVECPFTFWTDLATTGNLDTDVPKSARAILGGDDENSILNVYGGELEWDKWTVKLHANRGADNGVVLQYGRNIISLEQEENIQEVYTGICPYWKGSDELADNIVVLLPEGIIEDSQTSAHYPYPRIIPVDFSSEFEEAPTEEQLRVVAQQYLVDNEIGIPKVSIKLSFAQLWKTEEYKNFAKLERVNLCDEVTVVFEKLGVNAKAKVIKTDFNVLTERYNSIEIGEATSNLSDSFQSAAETTAQTFEKATSDFSREIERATAIIAGTYGGYVVFDRTDDGNVYQILVMDQPSKDDATNVIRINQNGIGFSQNGYEGPFNSAWVIDGTLDMSVINVINMTANLITTGIIRDRTGRNYWNLDTGEISIQATVADIGLGGRNYIRQGNTLTFSGYYFAYDFEYNGEQALLNGEDMEVAVG